MVEDSFSKGFPLRAKAPFLIGDRILDLGEEDLKGLCLAAPFRKANLSKSFWDSEI